jgi:hypothetical protein
MFVVNDLLDALFLGSFFFGLIFSGLSLFLGVADIGVGHFGGHGDHSFHVGHHDSGQVHGSDDAMSPLSVGTVLGFLTWFGGVSYLARNGLEVNGGISLLVGVFAGLAGGYVIFWLLRAVKRQQAGLVRAADDHLPGTIGRVSSSIRAGGTGEIVFERRGVRQVSAARSPSGTAIPRGTEVVILRHDRGIAHVEPWTSLVDDGYDALDADADLRGTDLAPPNRRPLPASDRVHHAR